MAIALIWKKKKKKKTVPIIDSRWMRILFGSTTPIERTLENKRTRK